jgi:hypothetical protein
MSRTKDDDGGAPPTRVGVLATLAQEASRAFLSQATAGDLLKLGELAKEARAAEQRAAVEQDRIAARRDLALRAMALREHVVDTVVKGRLDRSDRALDLLIDKLGTADDPATIAAVADAIAKVATTDHLTDVAELVAAIKADDLEF